MSKGKDGSKTQESAFNASLKTTEQLQIWESANNAATALSGAFGPTGYIQKKAAYYNQLTPGAGMKIAKNEWTTNMEVGILEVMYYQIRLTLYLQHHLRLKTAVYYI